MTYFKRKKRLLTGLLTLGFCFSMTCTGQAAAPEPIIQQNFQEAQLVNASFAATGRHILLLHEKDPCTGLANGQLVGDYGAFSSVNQNGHLLYPVRAISQYLGFTVEWDDEQRSARLTAQDGHHVIFTIDSKEALVDSEPHRLSIAPAIVDDKVMLPIRALVEALGGSVSYEQGLLILSDRKDELTEAESESLACMKSAYLQSEQETLDDPLGTTLLAQTDTHAYWRQGLDQLYGEADGIRQPIDLGSSVQLILGIYNDQVYYITGAEEADTGKLLNGQLCRADLTGQQRQVLIADYYGYTQAATKVWAASHTYFLQSGGHDYIIIRESSINLGGYNLYRLDDEQAAAVEMEFAENVYVNGLDSGFSDPLVFGDDLYHFSHHMGISTGLYHIQLRPDGTAIVEDKLFTDLAFYKIIALDDHQLLALAGPYQRGSNDHDMHIYQVDLNSLTISQLTNEKLPFSSDHKTLLLTNKGNALYFNQINELCQIPLLTQ